MSTTAPEHKKLWDLIKDIKFGMFTHRHANGMMHSQPLTTLNKSMDEGDKLYFFVSRTSDVAQQIMQDDNVNVSYSSPSDDSYVSVSGKALIVEDMGKKKALWSPMAKAWFPDGPTDPDLALVQVRISHAEYWDVKESKMLQVAKMVAAAITGTPPANRGEHKEVQMP
jgi:general stress protein 26